MNTAITLKKNTMLEILNVPAVKAWYRVLKEIQFMKFARKLSCTMPASELIISISTLTMNAVSYTHLHIALVKIAVCRGDLRVAVGNIRGVLNE